MPVFKLMTMLVQVLLITRSNGIVSLKNHVVQLCAHSLNPGPQFVDCCWFYTVNFIFYVSPEKKSSG